jgi:hypothetical protein
MTIEFVPFPKIARLSRECTITEKIDGTNAQIHIRLAPYPPFESGVDTPIEMADGVAYIRAGSRSRWLAQGGKDDNHGFGAWVTAHAQDLADLGVGQHFGEWWGSGIQRGYGLGKGDKRFSLFNSGRWIRNWRNECRPPLGEKQGYAPVCCSVVPVLYCGIFNSEIADTCINTLQTYGSQAAPGYMNPEGIVIWHDAARQYFKKTLNRDEEWKGKEAA